MRHTLPFHRSSHRFAAVASFLLVTAFLAATGCVSKGTYKSALAERDDAQARNAALQKDVEAAKARGDALTQEKGALEANNAALQQQIQDTQGRWYSMTIRPYKTVDNRIDNRIFHSLNGALTPLPMP